MKKKKLNQQLSLFSDEDFEEDPMDKTEERLNEKLDRITGETVEDNVMASSPVLPLAKAPKVTATPSVISTPSFSPAHYDHTDLFLRLSQSDFRSSFHLKKNDLDYIQKKGMDVIRQHAIDFIAKRLAPAVIPNDGKQTPMRGHPVFLAQHATACCCRGCFFKWHHIPPGRCLTPQEQDYAVNVLMTWITNEVLNTKQR